MNFYNYGVFHIGVHVQKVWDEILPPLWLCHVFEIYVLLTTYLMLPQASNVTTLRPTLCPISMSSHVGSVIQLIQSGPKKILVPIGLNFKALGVNTLRLQLSL